MGMSAVLPPRSWRRRLAITAAVLVLLYAVAGFFVVPQFARPQLETLVSDLVGKPVKIGSVGFNPFALSLSLHDVTLEGDSPSIAFEELYADVRARSLLRMAVVLDSLHLQAPHVRVVLDKQGNLNLAELFPSEEPVEPVDEAAADAELFPVFIASITIADGVLVFRDEQPAEPFELELTPVTLELNDFSTRRDHAGRYILTAKTEKDGAIEWTGDLSIDPLRAEGEIALDKIRARTLSGYAGTALPFGVKKGTLGLKTKYVYDGSGDAMQLVLGPGDLTVDGLELREAKDSPPFLTLPQLQIGGVEIDIDKEKVKIKSIQTKGARLQAWLDADGAMGPAAVFGEASSTEAETAAPAADEGGKGWSVSIGEVALSDYGLQFEDRSLAPPFAFAVEPITAKVGKLSFAAGKKADVEVAIGLPDEGKVTLTGTAGLAPLAVDLDLRVTNIILNRFQPYVARAVHISVDSGTAGAEGHLKVHAAEGEAPVIEYAGNASVTDVVVNDTIREEELVKWGSLVINDLAYQSEPATLHATAILLEQPYARVLIDKDGNLNVGSLAVEPAEPVTEAATTGSEAPPMAVAIDTLTIREGLTDFADYSIKPSVDAGIYGLHGTIEALSSDPAAKSKVALEGKVDKHAPVRISGVMNPFNPMTQTDIEVKFNNVSLTLFTPYSARFAGYKIKKGKASVELDYHIENRKLVAENSVVIDKLTLGEKVPGPDVTSLPVKLAVALLKDRNGQISINLPMRGDLDDPTFSYGSILTNTLFDLLTKTVASPFSVLGSLANFDSEDLRNIEFAAGSAELDEAQTKKLDAIGEALRERPELRLEVTGRADPVADKAGLLEAELIRELQRAKRAEMKEQGLATPKKLAQIDLSPEDYDRLFKAKYEATFGTEPPRDEQGGFAEVARTALVGSLEIDDEDLRKLAQKRASAIQDRLAEAGVKQERVYILEVEVDAEFDGAGVKSELSLTS